MLLLWFTSPSHTHFHSNHFSVRAPQLAGLQAFLLLLFFVWFAFQRFFFFVALLPTTEVSTVDEAESLPKRMAMATTMSPSLLLYFVRFQLSPLFVALPPTTTARWMKRRACQNEWPWQPLCLPPSYYTLSVSSFPLCSLLCYRPPQHFWWRREKTKEWLQQTLSLLLFFVCFAFPTFLSTSFCCKRPPQQHVRWARTLAKATKRNSAEQHKLHLIAWLAAQLAAISYEQTSLQIIGARCRVRPHAIPSKSASIEKKKDLENFSLVLLVRLVRLCKPPSFSTINHHHRQPPSTATIIHMVWVWVDNAFSTSAYQHPFINIHLSAFAYQHHKRESKHCQSKLSFCVCVHCHSFHAALF